MAINNKGIIVYESNNNIYINIAKECTAECIFCTKRYFSKRSRNSKNVTNIKENSPEFNPRSTDEIVKKLAGLKLSSYIEAIFSGTGERVRCLDAVIFGYVQYPHQPIYGYDLYLSIEPSVDEIIKELEKYDLSKYNEAVYTGMGDPLMRLDVILEITNWLAHQGIPARLDTIGHAKFLYPGRNVAKELASSGMKTISLSLNADNEETYNHLCKPHFNNAYQLMLEFAKEICESGMILRFTIVDLPIVDKKKCYKIARSYDADLIIRRFT